MKKILLVILFLPLMIFSQNLPVVMQDTNSLGIVRSGIIVNTNSQATTLPGALSVTNGGITVVGGGTFAGGLSVTNGTMTVRGLAYPTADGSANQFMKTDGAGTLSFGSLTPGFTNVVIYSSAGTYTWTNSSATKIFVQVWGGGGSGGSGSGGGGSNAGGGGGGGGYSASMLNIGATNHTFTVGSSSTFLGLTANPGSSGASGVNGSGGAGGSASGGQINSTGCAGSGGYANVWGGAGGCAASGAGGGLGGTSLGGATSGGSPGGGGGGGLNNNSGGAGGAGQVIIWY